MGNARDPLKPWRAQQASGYGRVDWVVLGGCMLTLEPDCGNDCSLECRCRCTHCEGEGTHLIVMHLTEEEAKRVAEMTNIGEVERFLLSLGDRFVYFPPTLEESYRHGMRQRVIENPDSADRLKVFPGYARYRTATR